MQRGSPRSVPQGGTDNYTVCSHLIQHPEAYVSSEVARYQSRRLGARFGYDLLEYLMVKGGIPPHLGARTLEDECSTNYGKYQGGLNWILQKPPKTLCIYFLYCCSTVEWCRGLMYVIRSFRNMSEF